MNRLTFPQWVRLLSWIGDLLLVVGATVLLIDQWGHLTAGFAAVLGLMVFCGCLLPVSVYYIEYLQQRQALRAAEVRAPETIQAVLAQLQQLVARVETAATDAAKTTLSARQVPGHLKEGTNTLEQCLGRLETLREGLTALPSSEDLAALRSPATEAPPVDLTPIQDALAELAQRPAPTPPPAIDLAPLEKAFAALRADLDDALAVREEKLEAIIEQLESLETVIADAAPGSPSPADEAADNAPSVSEPKEETAESAPEPQPAPPKKKTAKKKVARKKAPAAPPPVAENDLFGTAAEAGLPDGNAALVAKALVGVNNRVYARGDAPLRWDHGRPLEATGIGEWRLDLEALQEPIEIELRLNDEIAAKGPPLTLLPGQIVRADPQFPPANEPF